jgi:large subunit ribosomal protein L6
MSRVGKKPVTIPEKTTLTYKDRVLTVKGPKGSLTRTIHPEVDLKIDEGLITVELEKVSKRTRALQGLTRSLVSNMVVGVNDGFMRVLEINGIGYRAEVKGKRIEFNLGYSNPVQYELPEGISATVDRNVIRLSGIDKEALGMSASKIRQLRPPEPYKGKGIKYAEERIQKKAGKTGTK